MRKLVLAALGDVTLLNILAWVIVAWVMFFVAYAHGARLTQSQSDAQYAIAYGAYGSRHGGIELPKAAPKVWFTPRDHICAKIGRPSECPVRGLHSKGEIWLSDDLDFSDALDSSVLLHEFVHWFQYTHKGLPVSCEDWLSRELEAHQIQHDALVKARQPVAAAQVRHNARSLPPCR